MSRRFLLAGALVLAAPRAQAQQEGFQEVDRIVAIVGDSVIPLSRLDEETLVKRQQGETIPTDAAQLAQFRRNLLEELVNRQLMVQAALRDTTVQVTDQEVQSAADDALRQIRRNFASELEFRRELERSNFGSPDEYRRWLQDQQRAELLQSKLYEKLQAEGELAPLAPTEEELRAYYERTRPLQSRRPATVTFRQVVVRVEPDSASLAAAYRLADSLATVLRGDADFGQIARRFSDDVASAQQGGELGWVRRGQGLVPEFENAAFRLRPGAISPPVRTVFGYHIINVERAQPAEIQLRHILIQPDVTDADIQGARTRAEQAAQELLDGQPFDSVAARYHDFAGQEQALIEDFPKDQLPTAYQEAIAGADPGDQIGPIEIDLGDGRPKWAVIRFVGARPEGEYTFQDLRDQLRRQLSQQNAIDRYLRRLRQATFVEMRL
jgi:peptidyl-prolyl cis-trans isomerase SurA